MTEMASLVLFAADSEATAAFYRALGVEFEEEDHGEGPAHFAAEVGPIHFAIYPAQAPGRATEHRSGGGVFPGFYVASLDRAVDALGRVDSRILTEHEQMPWGCRVVVEDPDGRAIEVNQRRHCHPPPT
jgi:lactoylglutathione lyase